MLDKLEKKFGKYAIKNFSNYILMISTIGMILGLIDSSIYTNYLSLDFDAILSGQVWRLITFIFYPIITSFDFIKMIFAILSLYLYYYIGVILENTWGAFKFNIYYISGFLLSILSTLLIYFIFGVSISFGMKYINEAMFLAFATIVPENKIRLYFIIPIKMKWMGIIYAIFLVYEVLSNILTFTPGGIAIGVAIIISVLNFIIYFIASRKNTKKIKPLHFNKHIKPSGSKNNKSNLINLPAHSCCICGKNNISHPNISFRYCSKCEGEYEYCEEHLFIHEHIKKGKKI